MRAHDGTLALLTIFAWLVGCGLSGPPTPPPESPLSLPEKIFNKIGENAKLIMVLLKYQKIWNQQIICQHKCYSPVSGMKKSVIKGEQRMSENVKLQLVLLHSETSYSEAGNTCGQPRINSQMKNLTVDIGDTARWIYRHRQRQDTQKRTNANTQTDKDRYT